jgi:hypothetical protein
VPESITTIARVAKACFNRVEAGFSGIFLFEHDLSENRFPLFRIMLPRSIRPQRRRVCASVIALIAAAQQRRNR